jgi:chromosome segregation ATPase
VKFLLEWKAKISARDERGEAPLHFACYFGHEEVVDLLCASGAYIDVQSDSLVTPLHAATINRQLKCIALLVARGADLGMKDSNGKTAADLAGQDLELLSCFQNQAYQRLEDIDSLQLRAKRLTSQLEEEKERSRERDIRISNVYKQMKIMEDDHRVVLQQLQAANQRLEERNKETTSFREIAEAETLRRVTLENHLQELQAAFQRMEVQHREETSNVSQLEQQLVAERQTREQVESQQSSAVEEKENVIRALGGVIEMQQAESETLKSTLLQERQKAEGYINELSLKLRIYEPLNKEVTDLRDTKQYLQRQVLSLEETIANLTSQDLQHQTQLQTLQLQLKNQHLHIQQLNQRLSSQQQPQQQPSPQPQQQLTSSGSLLPQFDNIQVLKMAEELDKAKKLFGTLGTLVTIANSALSEATSKMTTFAASAAPAAPAAPATPASILTSAALPTTQMSLGS